MIDKKTVEYVAELSRLTIEPSEMNEIYVELNKILDYMNEINSTIDTDDVNLTTCVLSNVMRPDQVSNSMNRNELLANTPSHTEETPIVPKTVR